MTTPPKPKTNWFSVAALLCIPVLLLCAFLGLTHVIDIGSGWGIFVLAVGFNGLISAVLSLHYFGRGKI